MMPSPSQQNAAHRADAQWVKSRGKVFQIAGQRYISEYTNPFTGWAIRLHYGTGLRDGSWYVFDANGDIVEHMHSLTWAKSAAKYKFEHSNQEGSHS